MNDIDISMTMTNGSEQVSEDYKTFLYARATHSNHVLQYHMQQIIDRQKAVDKYRSMMMDGMSLIPLESNSYKNDPVVISHTIQMIEVSPSFDGGKGGGGTTPTGGLGPPQLFPYFWKHQSASFLRQLETSCLLYHLKCGAILQYAMMHEWSRNHL